MRKYNKAEQILRIENLCEMHLPPQLYSSHHYSIKEVAVHLAFNRNPFSCYWQKEAHYFLKSTLASVSGFAAASVPFPTFPFEPLLQLLLHQQLYSRNKLKTANWINLATCKLSAVFLDVPQLLHCCCLLGLLALLYEKMMMRWRFVAFYLFLFLSLSRD